MKLRKVLALALAGVMTLSLAACSKKTSDSSQNGTTPANNGDSSAVSLRIWGAEEDQDLLKSLVDKFKEKYSDVTFDIEIGVESEATAKDTILTDPEAAADVFAFASDQINELVAAKALANLDALKDVFTQYAGKSIDDIKAANGEGSVEAATVDGSMYAFPMAGGNGYFLFYDPTVFTDEDVQTWDGLLAAAEAAGTKVSMVFNSGWWNSSFFYGAGFKTALNADGSTYMDFNGTSADGITGVSVVKAMMAIASHPAFLASDDGQIDATIASGQVKAAVSGTWSTDGVATAFGEGYKACKLPTFTCDGKQIQQGSVAGFKFVGVNAYSKQAGWAALLAEFITNEESQAERFEKRQIGPTNKVVAASDAVAANKALAAVTQQDAFGFVQMVGGKFWDPTKTFGQMIVEGTLTDDAAIQAALDTLVKDVAVPAE